jgi:hypothetical protein
MTENKGARPPSTAAAPDLDWSQVRETVRMLHLSVAQIEMAMGEGDDSIDALSRSFTSMIGSVDAIGLAARDLPEGEGHIRQTIEASCGAVSGQVHQAIVAFQFYDRLSQRLNHVSLSLDALPRLVRDPGRLYNPNEWRTLQQDIRSQYSMPEEQAMFDALVRGADIADVLLSLDRQRRSGGLQDSEIELF